jgi:hypothetical protein
MGNSSSSLVVVVTFLALSAVETSAFIVNGDRSSPVRTKPTLMQPLYAVPQKAAATQATGKKPKKAAPKAKKASAKKAALAAADKFQRADVVASVAEKTGMTKVAAEEALMAVLDTITEVSIDSYMLQRLQTCRGQ